jgi:hypothetical protein
LWIKEVGFRSSNTHRNLHNGYKIHNLYLFFTDLLAETFDIASKSTATKNFAWIGFPHENYFVGREDELAKLQGYQSSERIKVAVISGLGGVGKSLLAFQYAKRKKNCTNCVWLRGEDKGPLLNSVNSIARQLKVQAHNANGTREQFEEMLTSIRSKINSSDQPWLFILDNVDSMHEFVAPIMNSLWKEPNLFFIVTSVLRNVASKRRTAVLMELGGFSDEDSDKFINEGLGYSNPELNQKLSKTLQSLPLAMDQAVQYIVDQKNLTSFKGKAYGIEDFLEEFENQKSAMGILDYKLEENEKTIFTTVKMCSAKIQALEGGEDTVTLLHILSYLDPDGIPLSFLEELIRNVEGTVEHLQDRLMVLKDYSLISYETQEITIHRVVQRIVPLIQLAAAQSLLKRVAVGTFKSLSNLNDNLFLNRPKRQVTIVWNHFKKNDNLICSISDYQCFIDKCLLKIDSSLLLTQSDKYILKLIGYVFCGEGDATHLVWNYISPQFTQLKDLIELEILQTGLAELTNKHGEDHPDVLYSRGKIISSQCALKMDVKYLEELSRLIAIADKKLGKCHPCTSDMKYRLAVCLYDDQEYTHALLIAKDIKPFLKASDRMYFLIRNLEVSCYKALGDVARASELHEEYSRELHVMRMDTLAWNPIANSCADEEEEFGKNFLNLEPLFPELYKLRSELVLKLENRNQRIQTQNSIVEQQNHIGTSDAKRSEAAVHQEMLQILQCSVTEALIMTGIRCRLFFTHERNFLKAAKILNWFLKRLKLLMRLELGDSDETLRNLFDGIINIT